MSLCSESVSEYPFFEDPLKFGPFKTNGVELKNFLRSVSDVDSYKLQIKLDIISRRTIRQVLIIPLAKCPGSDTGTFIAYLAI